MNNSIRFEQRLLEKIRKLPSDKIIEIEDFVDFLYQRETKSDKNLVYEATKLSENSFSKVWNNPEDVAYDKL